MPRSMATEDGLRYSNAGGIPVKAAIIGTSGHIDLALEVRDRMPQVTFVGVAPGPVTRTRASSSSTSWKLP